MSVRGQHFPTRALLLYPHSIHPAAIAKISGKMFENNPFVLQCPINLLPNELFASLFEMGMNMEIGAIDKGLQFGEDDDEDKESDEDEEIKETEVVVDWTNGEDDADWSDVDEEDETHKWGKKMKQNLTFQVLVSHVCKRWRSIALDTPALWTILYFEKGTPLDKHRTFIERTKNAPLTITIDCTFDDVYDDESDHPQAVDQNREKEFLRCLKGSLDLSDPSLPGLFGDFWSQIVGDGEEPLEPEPLDDLCYSISEFSEILDMILPHLHHWQVLCVDVTDYRWMYLLLARLHQCGPAETLEALRLYLHDPNGTGQFFHPYLSTRFTPFHGQAPCLRNCLFWGVHLDWDASLGILNNLNDIELAYHADVVRPSYGTLQAILERPNTKKLTLCLSGPRGTEDDWRNAGAQPIQIPSLQTLALQDYNPRCACSLLRFLNTPNLTALDLDLSGTDSNGLVNDLCKASHGRSKSLLSGLENLKVSGLSCGDGLIYKILDELVHLKHLELNCTDSGEMFFEALLEAVMVYCPALETIQTFGIPGKQMKKFVEVRSKAGVPVKKVIMSGKGDIGVVVEQWLIENVKEFEYYREAS